MTRAPFTRRSFLRGAAALSSLGLASRLPVVDLVATAAAQGSPAADYKALVCVFLYGGNDGNHTLVPLDAQGYAAYAQVRTGASGIQLAQDALLPIQPSNTSTPFGLHPELAELRTLFDSRRMAIVANVGTLTRPTTRAQYAAGVRPPQLYSHSDQQAQWQSSVAGPSATGWGGRVADAVAGSDAPAFPVATSLGGSVLFALGEQALPLSVPASGAFALQGFGSGAAAQARLAAVRSLLAQPAASLLVQATAGIGAQALALSSTVNPILAGASPAVDDAFGSQRTSIANQLRQVGKLIAARATTGARRQVFFVSLGSFDTHSDQANRQAALFAELSPALKAFADATVALGVAHQVTTFTLSDFGRTFQPAAGGGSDHAWGSHHLVIGDAVAGGTLYGRYPELALGGPDDAEKEGRWIPTTSVDQYGATLARWFGVPEAELADVFPNLGAFPTSNLGFMG